MTRLACIVAQPAPWSADVSVAILSLATVVGPLALGATGPWSRFGLEAAMAAAVSLWPVSGTKCGRAFELPLVIAGQSCGFVIYRLMGRHRARLYCR